MPDPPCLRFKTICAGYLDGVQQRVIWPRGGDLNSRCLASSCQESSWLIPAGRQHYLDATVAYKRAVLNCVDYLSKFGYTKEQVSRKQSHAICDVTCRCQSFNDCPCVHPVSTLQKHHGSSSANTKQLLLTVLFALACSSASCCGR